MAAAAAVQRQNHSHSTLIAAMDGLWFHQIILFSNPISLITVSPSPPPQAIAKSSSSCQSSPSHYSPKRSAPPPPPDEEEESTPLPQSHESEVDDEEDSTDHPKINEFVREKKEGPTCRLNLMMMKSKARSFSSSPSPALVAKHAAKNGGRLSSVKSLPKPMMICRSLWDLELEEVKGFLDLGFKFKKQHLSRRMITVIPGLQRILAAGGLKTDQQPCEIDDDDDDDDDSADDDDDDDDHETAAAGGGIMRPYLSEAWLIKRPDSPLLNLKMPKVSASADMKKHLWNWARTVAYVIQHES